MQISFYVLNDRFISNTASSPHENEAVLDFVCKLTETVLKKSALSLVIVDDDHERLKLLDHRLWTFDPTSFIPHSLIQSAAVATDPHRNDDDSLTKQDHRHPTIGIASPTPVVNEMDHRKSLVDLAAPVVLSSHLPAGFDGVVLNLASSPLSLTLSPGDSTDNNTDETSTEAASTDSIVSPTSYALPDRILEIIAPDETSKQQGRDKYKHYRSQGFTLKYFPID